MMEQIPAYAQVDADSKQHVTNQKWNAFLEQTRLEYEQKFPGHTSTWEFKDIGKGGTDAQRAECVKKVSII